jgi:phosphohistidine phosphatase SixA
MQKRCGRRALLALLTTSHLSRRLAPAAAEELPLRPVTVEEPAGESLVARLRAGGLVLFFRHADTRGEPCDRSFRVGDRPGQRSLSEAGRTQVRRIGERLRDLGVPVGLPVLAGPVYRARDTAEEAFGAGNVVVNDGLMAYDFAGGRLGWVLDQHRQLFSTPVPAGVNRVLVGHRTPAIMVAGEAVGGRAFPEGTALVVTPGGDGFRVLGILALAPLVGDGFHGC